MNILQNKFIRAKSIILKFFSTYHSVEFLVLFRNYRELGAMKMSENGGAGIGLSHNKVGYTTNRPIDATGVRSLLNTIK